MGVETMSLADEIRYQIMDEIERRKQRHFEGASEWAQKLRYRWVLKGSAGYALKWFDEIAKANPDATRDELARMLEARINTERSAHPQLFTGSHLKGILAIVKGTYNEADYA